MMIRLTKCWAEKYKHWGKDADSIGLSCSTTGYNRIRNR